MSKASTKTKDEYASQFKSKKPEKPITWKDPVDKKIEQKKNIEFINETKKDQITEITYVTKCENCQDSTLQDRVKELEAKLRKYEGGSPVKKTGKRLRSLGS